MPSSFTGLTGECTEPASPAGGGSSSAAGSSEASEEEVVIVVTQEDFARLDIHTGHISISPPNGWTLVQIDTYVWTEAEPQVIDTEILDTPVAIRATPVQYTWDFADGTEPLTTTDPGGPYPDGQVTHVYTNPYDGLVITLTITWSGEYSVDGGPWQPIDGTIETDIDADPLDVRAYRTYLIHPDAVQTG